MKGEWGNKGRKQAREERTAMTTQGADKWERHRVDKFMGPTTFWHKQHRPQNTNAQTCSGRKNHRRQRTHFMYSKRNWLAEHFTPLIFIQPFHLHRDPNLNSVILEHFQSCGQRIPDRKFLRVTRKQPPLVVRFFKKEGKVMRWFLSVASGSFVHAGISAGNILHCEMWPFQDRQTGKNTERWKQTHEQTVCGFTLTVWDGDTWTAVCHGLEEACWAPDTSDDPLCPRSPTSLQHRARDMSGQQQMSAFAIPSRVLYYHRKRDRNPLPDFTYNLSASPI